MSEYLIGLDIGSSALKAVLASPAHGVIAVAERGYPMHRPRPGWAENDPEELGHCGCGGHDEHETNELFDRIARDRILDISGTPATPEPRR